MATKRIDQFTTVTPDGTEYVLVQKQADLTYGKTTLATVSAAAAPVQSVAGRTGAVTLTKADVALSNVDNTSDVNKPISTATQTALNAKLSSLTGDITTSGSVATLANTIGSSGTSGSSGTVIPVITYDAKGRITALSSTPVSATGLTITESQVTNLTTDLAAKASTTYVDSSVNTAVANLVNSSPAALDTLKELADAIGDDANYAATVTTALAAKAPMLNPTTVKTAAYTASANDFVPVDTTSNPVTITLPSAPANGTRFGVKLVVQGGTNTVTVTRGGTDVFNKTGGNTSVTITLPNQGVQFQYNNGIWYGVAADIGLTALDARYQAAGSYAPATGIAESAVTNLTSDLGSKVQLGGDIGGTITTPTVSFANDTLHVLKAGDTMTGQLTLSAAGPNILTVGDVTTLSAGLTTRRVAINDNINGVSGVQMENVSTGTASEFRFIIKDTTDHYFAFSQGSTGNTASLFGQTCSAIDSIFNNGGTIRHMAIGTVPASDLIFGTSNTERMRIYSTGDSQFSGNVIPITNVSKTLGTTALYWSNLYASRLNLNATAYLDGGTAGKTIATGAFQVGSAASVEITDQSTYGRIQTYNSTRLALNSLGNNVTMFEATAGNLGLVTSAPTHTMTLGSSSTGIALYNTSDQTTNYERVRQYWNTNVYTIATEKGGTGTVREININGAMFLSGGFLHALSGIQIPNHLDINYSQGWSIFTSNNAASSGISNHVAIKPTLTQSATAGYTALLINPTETTVGSGSKLLIDAQVGGSSKFSVTNAGYVTAPRYYLNSTAYIDGATAGVIQSNASLYLDTSISTTSAPTTFGFNGMTAAGMSGRFQFGDNSNAMQNGYGAAMQLYSYHRLELSGGRRAGGPSYVTGAKKGLNLDDVSVMVDSTQDAQVVFGIQANSATQSSNLTTWYNSTGTALSGVNASGQHVMATSAGTPTGTPANGTMVFDTTASKLWVYNGAWKSVALA